MPAEFSGGTQSEIVNGNRSAPGDSGKPESDEDEQQGANGVEVHDRVSAHAPEHARRVAEHPGGPGVHEFVNGNGDDKGYDDRDKIARIRVPESGHQITLTSPCV